MHSVSGGPEDFLGVGPWMDDVAVDSGSYLHEGAMDPTLQMMNKGQQGYPPMNTMQPNSSMMMYGSVQDQQSTCVSFCVPESVPNAALFLPSGFYLVTH